VALLRQAAEGDVRGIDDSLKAGADPNFVPNPVGTQSPLINAARRGHLAAVRLLLQHGALPNIRTTDETPLHAAAARGQTEVVGLLLAWGANYRARIATGGQYVMGDALSGGHGGVVWLLYKEGATIDPAYLCGAISDGHSELVDVLLNTGLDPRTVDCSGRSPLDLARRLAVPQREEVSRLLARAAGHGRRMR
jgi:ankyrin repeat protein